MTGILSSAKEEFLACGFLKADARCSLKDSPIVILDEATASGDADNESCIQAAIPELCKGKTLLVIAHRLHVRCGT